MSKVIVKITGPIATTFHLEGQNNVVHTDATGKLEGKAFSPTDVLAGALASCLASMMSYTAERKGIDLTGLSVEIEKTMQQSPLRVASFNIKVTCPVFVGEADRKALEMAAKNCPVKASLLPDIAIKIDFIWA